MRLAASGAIWPSGACSRKNRNSITNVISTSSSEPRGSSPVGPAAGSDIEQRVLRGVHRDGTELDRIGIDAIIGPGPFDRPQVDVDVRILDVVTIDVVVIDV